MKYNFKFRHFRGHNIVSPLTVQNLHLHFSET